MFDTQNVQHSVGQGGSQGFGIASTIPRTNITIGTELSNNSPENMMTSMLSSIPANKPSLGALSMEILRFPTMSDSLSHWIHNNLGTNLWYRAGPEVTKKWLISCLKENFKGSN